MDSKIKVFVVAVFCGMVLSTTASAPAQAGEPPEMIEICKARHSSLAGIQSCVNDLRFGQVEQMQAKTDDRLARVEAGQGEIRKQLGGIETSLDELKDRQAPQPAVQAPPATSQSVSYSTGRAPTVQVGGVPFRVLPRPSLVSVYSALASREADTLRVTQLAHRDSSRQCGGNDSGARVLITNHGIPVPVWAPEGAASGFTEVYADMNRDGQPDPTPYKVLDPRLQDDFWVTWRAGDDLRVIYLREAGDVLAIQGLPLQTLWRPATHEDSTPSACRPATASSPGGNKSIPAYGLWRVW